MSIIGKLVPKGIRRKVKSKMLEIVKEDLRNTEVEYRIYSDEEKRLNNKIAIVTGGAGAIGSAISFKLAMEGAHVIVVGRTEKNCQEVVKYIKEHNGNASACKMDVTDYEDIKRVFKEVFDKYGRIDILVNNAGGSARGNANIIERQKIEVIDDMLNTNLRGVIMCCKESIQYMKKNNWGRIVNIASTCGVNGLAGFSEYSASKSGVICFTKSLAMELAKDNITVNCVSPGLTSHILWDLGLEDTKTNKTYVGKKCKTDDISNAVEFFCKEESRFVIGQNLIVDGGRSLGLKGD